MSGGGVTPSPTPSVSDTFFWRYDEVGDATWLVNSEGQLVKAKQMVGIDDVSIGYIRNIGGDSVDIEATTMVTEQWGEQRAEFNGSPEADWSITMDDETLSYNGVLTPSVTQFVLVSIWADEQCSVKPTGETDHVFAQVKVTFGQNSKRQWGAGGSQLSVETPPPYQYAITWYYDFTSGEMSDPIVPGVYRLNCAFGPAEVEGWVTEFT